MTPDIPVLSRSSVNDSTTSVTVLRAYVEAVEQAGVPRADFLRAAGLDLAALDAPEGRVSRAEVYRVAELALDLTGDPALGLHWSERVSDRAFVPVSQLLAHASTLRQAFELLAQYSQLLSDETAYRIDEEDASVTLRCVPITDASSRVEVFVLDMTVSGFWRLVRSFRADARPERVSFAFSAPPHHAEYARAFGCEVCFDQPFTGFVFDRALLDAPSRAKDDDVREALEAIAERRLLRVAQRTPYARRVREVLVRDGRPHRTDMKAVARALEMSVRSLRRRLDDEGKSYNEILTEALAIVATRLVRDGRRTTQEIAFEMGFSEPSAFYRAFKRWTGTTPNECREARPK